MSVLQSKDYSTKFHCKDYLKAYYSSPSGSDDEEGASLFQFQQLCAFYEKYSCKWDRDTAKILEFGGGPVISGLISAAPHVREIVFAAYTESERNEVDLWKQATDGAHDWSACFKYIVRELESKAGDGAWQEREALLRSKLTITTCDIKQEHPIGIVEADPTPFTIVYTSLCLEAACSTYIEYKTAVKKIGKLLKPGGYLAMFVAERETFYIVGERKWFCLPLTLAQIKEALEEAGFELLMAERDPAPVQQIQNPTVSDFKAVLFVAAYKVEFKKKHFQQML